MNAQNYHPSRWPHDACRLAESGWVCLPNPLVGWGREGTLRWKFGVLLRHVLLVGRCWRTALRRYVLVREFSTFPLLLVFPLLRPLRSKLLFFIHHNLQWAARSRIEAWGFRLLTRLGAQWATYEVQPDCAAVAVTVLHPVPRRIAGEKKSGNPVIGVAGYYRPEKGMDELLRLLLKEFPECEVIAGVPNPEALQIAGVKVVSTASDADYRAMLSGCDVLVQNNAKDSYFYRASGPVADAAASGTAVVAPDFPVIKHQILFPVPVGATFRTPDGLAAVVRHVIEQSRSGGYDFDLYCAARTAQAAADRLDEFVRKRHD